MPKFRITVTVHKDFIIDVDGDTKEDVIAMVDNDMSEYISGIPEDYCYAEITDVEMM